MVTFRKNELDEGLLRYDPILHAATSVSYHNRLVHDGLVFRRVAVGPVALGDGNSFDLLLQSPGAELLVSMDRVLTNISIGPADLFMFEGTTISDVGDIVTLGNSNRRVPTFSQSVLSENPIITDDGDLIGQWLLISGGGKGDQRAGTSEGSADDELLLAPDQAYLFRVTNNSGSDVAVSYSARIQEVPESY